MKEHKWPIIRGLVQTETVKEAFCIELEILNFDEPLNETTLSFLVWYYGGIWYDKEAENE